MNSSIFNSFSALVAMVDNIIAMISTSKHCTNEEAFHNHLLPLLVNELKERGALLLTEKELKQLTEIIASDEIPEGSRKVLDQLLITIKEFMDVNKD